MFGPASDGHPLCVDDGGKILLADIETTAAADDGKAATQVIRDFYDKGRWMPIDTAYGEIITWRKCEGPR